MVGSLKKGKLTPVKEKENSPTCSKNLKSRVMATLYKLKRIPPEYENTVGQQIIN